jgi:ankyrin repeat protein
MLQSGADIHEIHEKGVTALHRAVRFRSLMTARMLIEHGANVH